MKSTHEVIDADNDILKKRLKICGFNYKTLCGSTVFPLYILFQYIPLTSYSSLGIRLGLSLSPRDKLEAFYAQHNPEKLKDKYFLDKTLRKWRGREDLLFEVCCLKDGSVTHCFIYHPHFLTLCPFPLY